MASLIKKFSERTQDLRARIERARARKDGCLQSRSLWDEHLALGDEIRDAAHAGKISDEEWRDLIKPIIECAELIIRMPLDEHFYNPR